MQNDGPGEAVVCSEPSSGAGPDPESGSGGGGAAMAPVLCIVISRPEDVADLKAGYAAADGGPDLKAGDRDEAAAIAAAVSRCESEREQCRVCQVPTDEPLMDLGCRCRGELAKAHRSCIDIWFQSRGSNKCEICQQVTNVPSPECHPSTNDWVWRVGSVYGGAIVVRRDRQRRCFNPLWVAFAILIGGLSLDVLLSISLGVSALPVNIIIGLLIVTGLGTVVRIALESCCERRGGSMQSSEAAINPITINPVYHPAGYLLRVTGQDHGRRWTCSPACNAREWEWWTKTRGTLPLHATAYQEEISTFLCRQG